VYKIIESEGVVPIYLVISDTLGCTQSLLLAGLPI